MRRLHWRILFIVAAICMGIGGPQHPRGESNAEMLADPVWFASHAWVCASFVAMLAGLVLFRRSHAVPSRTGRWLKAAIVVTALETVEMALHTVAYVDLPNLLAGQSTPIYTTHMTMAMIVYPIFGVLFSAFILVAARERALGSIWIAPIGIIGALAHGAAGLLVVGFGITSAGIGFPMIMLVMVWAFIAALMPVRPAAVPSAQPDERSTIEGELRRTPRNV
jgi:hypothetical protein